MNQLGMIVDLAHATFEATLDAIDESRSPILVSVADSGGVIGAWPAGIALDDLDANYNPVLTSYEQFPDVTAGLVGRGMDTTEVDRVLGGNFIDLFTAVTEPCQS